MGPVPEQVLPGTSTGPLNKVNTLNPQPFTLGVAGRFGGGYPKAPRPGGPGPLRGPQARPGGGGAQKPAFLVFLALGPPGPPWAPWAPPGPPWPWAPLAPPGPPEPCLGPLHPPLWAPLDPLRPPGPPGPPGVCGPPLGQGPGPLTPPPPPMAPDPPGLGALACPD